MIRKILAAVVVAAVLSSLFNAIEAKKRNHEDKNMDTHETEVNHDDKNKDTHEKEFYYYEAEKVQGEVSTTSGTTTKSAETKQVKSVKTTSAPQQLQVKLGRPRAGQPYLGVLSGWGLLSDVYRSDFLYTVF